MHEKRLLTILLTVILFVSCAVLGLANVYRITAVSIELTFVSEEAQAEAETLEKEIENRYSGKNIFFVDDTNAVLEFEEYPHFLIQTFEKSYPNRIVIKAEELPEVYAVEKSDRTGYYVLSSDGTLLREKPTSENRSDGKENVLISVSDITIEVENGQKPVGDEMTTVLSMCLKLDEKFDGIRTNVLSVSANKKEDSFLSGQAVICFREGVQAVVYGLYNLATLDQKTEWLYEKYVSLSVEERFSGTIYVNDYEAYYEADE